MDTNIDPEIDPQIDSHSGLFDKYTLPDQNEYINQPHSPDQQHYQYEIDNSSKSPQSTAEAAVAAAAAAAAANLSNIIDFNGERSDSNRVSHQESLNFLRNALDLDQDEGRTTSQTQTQAQAQTQTQTQTSLVKPKQQLVHDADSNVSIVVVNPGSQEGTARLGRPRKHKATVAPNSSTSYRNQEEAMISTFRVDAKPLGGPGSRGGRKNKTSGRRPLMASNLNKRKIQTQLSFPNKKKLPLDEGPITIIDVSSDSSDDEPVLSEKSKLEKESTPEVPEKKLDVQVMEVSSTSESEPEPEPQSESTSASEEEEDGPTIILENYETLTAKGRSTARERPTINGSISLVPLRHHQRRKEIYGPLAPLNSDLYELNEVNFSNPELNKIALGYTVKPTPYAKDIILILGFYNKFKKVFVNIPNLSPQDIEIGLKIRPSRPYGLSNVNEKPAKKDVRDGEVSEEMQSFFKQLLALTLNNKFSDTEISFRKSLRQLQNAMWDLGLPIEWRDDSRVFEIKKTPLHDEPVDPEMPEILFSEQETYQSPRANESPIDDEEFLDEGLQALAPYDRLILLRSLTQWALSNSEIIKHQIAQLSQANEYGDKETIYAPRYVKEGAKGVEANNKKAQLRKKGSKEPVVDAADNPYKHPLSFRILSFFVGDGGINGRFYLVRTFNAGKTSLSYQSEMKKVEKRSKHQILAHGQPSKFKLYVQDLGTTMLNINENEETTQPTLDPWYEIASTPTELSKFITFLQSIEQKPKHLVQLTSYLEEIQPLLAKFDRIHKEYAPTTVLTRSSRRTRTNMAALREQDRVLKELIDESDSDSGSDGN